MGGQQEAKEADVKPGRRTGDRPVDEPAPLMRLGASTNGHSGRTPITSGNGAGSVRADAIPRLHARVETFPRPTRPPRIRPKVLLFAEKLPIYLSAATGSRALTRDELFGLARTSGRLFGKRPTSVAVDGLERCDAQELEALNTIADAGIPVVPFAEAAQRFWRMHPLNGEDVVLPRRSLVTASLIRAFDVLIGFIGCLLLLITLPFVSLAIWLEDRGPLFYSQRRIGLNGNTFGLHKFRSMHCDAESTGPVWACAGDNRVTRVGAVLRRSKLDELPQFFNILVGEMSLIGPRPERPFFVEVLREQIPHYDLRHTVRPGLTGWATVKVGYGNSLEAKHLAHQFDIYYLKNRSFSFDCEILLRSVLAVVVTPAIADRFML